MSLPAWYDRWRLSYLAEWDGPDDEPSEPDEDACHYCGCEPCECPDFGTADLGSVVPAPEWDDPREAT